MKVKRQFLPLIILLVLGLFSLSSFAQDNNGNDNGNGGAGGNSNGNGGGGKITICHATGSATNPYNEITISVNGLNGHDGHDGDIIPAPEGGCGATASPTAVPNNNLCGMFPDDGSFPILNEADCLPDTSVIERAAWQPVVLAAPVCLDWLVYHTNETGDWELFRLGALPNDANLNLTRASGAADIAPSRSPDGQWITYMSNRDGNWEIYISAVEGDFVQRISYNSSAIERDPVWSPTGGHIVYESNRTGTWNLYIFDVQTGSETNLTSSAGNDINAFWSQDGSKVVFQSDREGLWQIFEKTVSNGEVRRLSDGTSNDVSPQYVYNAMGLVFRSFRDSSNSVLYWMNTDGSISQPISDAAGNALNHSIAPQGTFVAYNSNLDGDNDIYVFEFATGLTRQLTNNTVSDYAPTWYCGEPSLSFNSDITGNPDLFSASVLPMQDPPIVLEQQANQLTNEDAPELYPMMAPSEENASNAGNLFAPMNNS